MTNELMANDRGEDLRRDLQSQTTGEVRFDQISRALYSTDASVYQIQPQGVVLPRSREDLIRTVKICSGHGCALTMRGGGTSQAGQAIGPGIIVDTSKYLNRVLELNVKERWARVEPGIVLDELNAQLKIHSLRFAPDISTASRATIGGMMANNSSGRGRCCTARRSITCSNRRSSSPMARSSSFDRCHPTSSTRNAPVKGSKRNATGLSGAWRRTR
jgi:hypothetical protein